MPVRPQQRLLEEAFYPVDARHGTPYPCRQRDLDVIRHHPSHNRGPWVSQRQATMEIVQQNDFRRRPPSYEREAIRRLFDAVHDAAQYPWGPDLVIKSFLDLDTVFFEGALRGYVRVSWKGREGFGDEEQGHTTDCSRTKHALINLSAEAILLDSDPFKSMFSTVLHEMCHAFELVRVRNHEMNPNEGHHAEFGTRIHAVDRRAKALLGLQAIEEGEVWPRYHVESRAF